MKKNSISVIIFFIFSLFVYNSCADKQPPPFNPQKTRSILSPALTLETGKMLQHYFQLKDALVAMNDKDARIAATSMRISLSAFKKMLLEEDTVQISKTVVLDKLTIETDSLLLHLNEMLSKKNDNCELKRISFQPLSELTYRLLKDIHVTNIATYHLYCPMAFNEEGAWWLSNIPKVENPYFGKKMLSCGEVVDTIK